ncbi:hypothetical protein IY145_13705 [Methylosinus sp. H3A]|uniref:hypothetical protein n=1 Tax=Methylosinus sp. H3A TaxID=2785786 RepID=UPI0018C23BA2|nr:hypothetical protein [Methylosinus sp. H3A]MBG0810426.1 hypothetical protein [Methylosinus sp. H3A]
MHAILEAVFPSRIRAVRALLAPAGPDAANALAEAAENVRAVLERVHDDESQADWQALSEAVSIAAKLRSWHRAVRTGEADADRFLRAARLQLYEWQTADAGYGHELRSRLSAVNGDFAATDVGVLLEDLARVTFPVAIFTTEPPTVPHWRQDTVKAKSELAVAFLEFRINGKEAAAIHRLPADRLHDLELKLRVSRWPEEAERLVLKPISVEPEDVWTLPEFSFARPKGNSPFTLETYGRLSIRMRIAIGARPLEFLYSAEFQPVSAEQPVAVAGQRSLRIDSSEFEDRCETGYPSLDAKLIEVRNRLRDEPRISEREIGTALHLFKPLANLVGQAVHANLFPSPLNEAAFESHVAQHLRRHPEIGVELEVQAQAGGGRTDLSFRQMRIELKVKNDAPLSTKELEKYSLQASAYAVGSDKTIAILCVLDGSEKKAPPTPMVEAIKVIPVQPNDRPIYVIAFIIQGNLAKPSTLSR